MKLKKNWLALVVIAIIAVAAFLWVRGAKAAEAVTQVAPPTDWFAIGLIVVVAALCGVVFYLWKYHPGAIATAKAGEATALGVITQQVALIRRMADTHADAVAKIPTPAAPTPPAPDAPPLAPAGKNGVAGTFNLSIAVTGNPATDVAAISAEANRIYFG